MERKIGLSSRRARSNASSPHGYQSTGLCACWRRYGDDSFSSRFAGRAGSFMGRILPHSPLRPGTPPRRRRGGRRRGDNRSMTSIGDTFRRKTAEADDSLTPAERVQRALRLGDDDAEAFRRARGITRAAAEAELASRRRAGRLPSRVAGS